MNPGLGALVPDKPLQPTFDPPAYIATVKTVVASIAPELRRLVPLETVLDRESLNRVIARPGDRLLL
jgi:hypothetical protein